MNRTAASALRQLSALDPATKFSTAESASEIDLRIERILASPQHPEAILIDERARKAWLRTAVGGLAVSLVLAVAGVMAWASPAQGVFASHTTTAVSLSALHAPARPMETVSPEPHGSTRRLSPSVS